MYRMVGFDLDGTLAETFPIIFESFRMTVLHFTGKTIDNQTILTAFGRNEQGILSELLPNIQIEKSSDIFYKAYRTAHLQLRSPFYGVLELLKNLHHQKIITPLITGKGKISTEISLEMLGLKEELYPILTGSDKENNKATHFISLLENYNINSSEFVYIGDTVSDIKQADLAGISCLSACWSKYANFKVLKAYNAKIVLGIEQVKDMLLK
ncbi:HAD family hydrolase [Oenococcus oeni]|uniref:Phosphoglycolate phosphatase haloacid dehalogenase hydrolase n=1 Tax=Oenococcus oeni TaxID=1247 RepID=A0A483BL58_OENOE|nr:HAD hydrolase-like protein [Oenococcus oeni]KGI01190.1 hypothetical protein X293_07100 [Oenococcus oeni IOEB_C52]MDV7686104.1 HAD hydrolase-like protein [Oenococcus oeni]OIK55922.1 hypothetical protein ATW61_09870 [Oenococcus oeni]OIK85129.1 hypothetical protein ATW79_09920 [Oenococcus oeni]OIL09296.1 hypothetical protein ATW92_04475 [Oenococcus oeni]